MLSKGQVGTICQNRKELPQAAKAKQQLHETTIFKTIAASTIVILTCYQCKKAKFVIILSMLHPDVGISSENNTKKKPERVLFYNKTKAGVDVVDQMTRNILLRQQVKGGLIDLAIINS